MTLRVRHAKVAVSSDSGDGKVSSNAWNDDHVLSGTANMVLGFDSNGEATEIDPSTFASAASSVADRTALAALADTSRPIYLREAGREGMFEFDSSDLSAEVTADHDHQGIYIAPATDTTGASGAWARAFEGTANVRWFGALGDGAADDTGSFAAAFANASQLHIPAGTYVVSSISIPAGAQVTTAGHDTIIKRKAGTADGTRIINILGSNVRLGDISVQGLIASEGDEQNHAIFIQANATNGNLQNISVGNVKATDIRGDAVYIGAASGYSVQQVTVGNIYANNCYRCGLAVVDAVSGVEVASVVEGACGQHTVDVEPNGFGSTKGVHIGYVRGRRVQFGGTATQSVEVSIDAADLDPAYGSNSTPANAFDPQAASQAAGTSNAIVVRSAILRIGRLNANGHTGQVCIQASGGAFSSKVIIDSALATNCCTTDTVYSAYFMGDTDYQIGQLKATTTLSTHSVFVQTVNAQVGKAEVALVTGSKYMNSCTDCRTEELLATVSGAGNGGSLLRNCTRCFVGNGTQAGDKFLDTCTSCLVLNSNATMATGNDISGTNNFFNPLPTFPLKANNLSDLPSASTARTNLGAAASGLATASGLTASATDKILGRSSAGSGALEEIACTAAGRALIDDADAAAQRTTLGLGTAATQASTAFAPAAPQIQAVTSSATVTPTFSNDQVNITAQAVGLTLANPSGTAVDGWGVVIRIKDNGSSQSIAYGTQYRAVGVTLPTATAAGKVHYLGCVWNAAATKLDVLAVAQEA